MSEKKAESDKKTELNKKPEKRKAEKPKEKDDGKDTITVTDAALATMIGLAAHEVPGVIGMSPANIKDGIKRILGVSDADEGVKVARATSDTNVDLHVVVAYGVNIPVVADLIRERVQYAAKTYAGVELENVRVHIAGVSRA
ncbi:MAG: Asp23/Gls24 family envelope stress response protein [Trueperaceae bacterium]